MDIKKLKYFVTVVEEGTISAAAKKLYMSQPPLSHQLSKLESDLDCKLFERTSRHIELTEVGKLLYTRAKILINNFDIIEEEIKDFENTHAGIIRIGIVSSVADTEISVKIAEFAKANQNVVLDIFESNTFSMLDRISSKTLHFAIVRTPFTATNFKQEIIRKGRVVAIGRKSFFDTNKTTISLEELSKKPLILYRRWEAFLSEFFNKATIPFNIVCRNDDARTSIFYAEQGIGIALVPISAAHSNNPDVVCYDIEDGLWETDIALIYDEASYMPVYAKLLLEYLKE